MNVITDIGIIVIAVLHIIFMIVEMFLWDKPAGFRIFGQSPSRAAATKTLAANQGLYNGFIAAGLITGVLQGSPGFDFKLFFLLCVIAAGLFGGFTAGRKILYIQALPGLMVLVLLLLS